MDDLEVKDQAKQEYPKFNDNSKTIYNDYQKKTIRKKEFNQKFFFALSFVLTIVIVFLIIFVNKPFSIKNGVIFSDDNIVSLLEKEAYNTSQFSVSNLDGENCLISNLNTDVYKVRFNEKYYICVYSKSSNNQGYSSSSSGIKFNDKCKIVKYESIDDINDIKGYELLFTYKILEGKYLENIITNTNCDESIKMAILIDSKQDNLSGNYLSSFYDLGDYLYYGNELVCEISSKENIDLFRKVEIINNEEYFLTYSKRESGEGDALKQIDLSVGEFGDWYTELTSLSIDASDSFALQLDSQTIHFNAIKVNDYVNLFRNKLYSPLANTAYTQLTYVSSSNSIVDYKKEEFDDGNYHDAIVYIPYIYEDYNYLLIEYNGETLLSLAKEYQLANSGVKLGEVTEEQKEIQRRENELYKNVQRIIINSQVEYFTSIGAKNICYDFSSIACQVYVYTMSINKEVIEKMSDGICNKYYITKVDDNLDDLNIDISDYYGSYIATKPLQINSSLSDLSVIAYDSNGNLENPIHYQISIDDEYTEINIERNCENLFGFDGIASRFIVNSFIDNNDLLMSKAFKAYQNNKGDIIYITNENVIVFVKNKYIMIIEEEE